MVPAPLRRAAADQQAAVRSFFDAEAPEYVRSRARQHSFAVQRDLVLGLLPDRCARVLDVGCGPAVMAEPLLERGSEVWGVDTSERMIRLGEERLAAHPARERVRLRVGTLEGLDFADGAFDAAIAMGVLEYVADRVRALAGLRRVLRPGGVLVLTVPSGISAYHLARGAWVKSLATLRRAVGRAPASDGFSVRRCVPWLLDRDLARAGLVKLEARFCNFIFFPLQELAPAASLAVNQRLGGLADHPLGACLGTQYVVQAMKR
ncbi:MAG: class I SAM-dependent methyltransferase [Clostridia bacterium]